MIPSRPTLVLLSLGLAAALGASGCAPVLIGAAATAGIVIAQERTVGDAIDDTVIQARIKDRLLQQSSNLFLRVSTEVLEGRVLLTGSVASAQDRIEAVRVAWTVPGVREVFNEIQVSERGGIANTLADARTTATLRFQIMGDRNIVDINYSIDTVNGIVYLMGIAQNQAELDRVVGYARNISGVRQVISHVVLRNDPRR
jgi:osmotically-inducible protein OsmY